MPLSEQDRKQILSLCPLTEELLSPERPVAFEQVFAPLVQLAEHTIDTKWGADTFKREVARLHLVLHRQLGIYHPDLRDEQATFVTALLIGVGYELGQNRQFFANDVRSRLIDDYRIRGSALGTDTEKIRTAFDIATGLGAAFEQLSPE